MPPKHLVLLQAMFPGVLMLDIDQIASLMRYGRGHLYNLHCEGKLPFKVSRGVGNKILVSVVEMAAYLDKEMLSEYSPPPPQPAELVVKKRGRPRGATSKTSPTVYGFQSELRSAIYRVRATELLAGIRQGLSNSVLDGEETLSDGERLRQTVSRLSATVEIASNEFEAVHARLSHAESSDIPYAARQIPFFLSPDGLVAALPIELDGVEVAQQADYRVHWMTWSSALSLVWLDEAKRLAWLEKMAVVMPDLCKAVDSNRRSTLLGV